jgi:glycosyltransferase involved in cell wall biosynthesis
MRILYIVADGNPGGGTTHVLQLLDAWRGARELGLITQVGSYLESKARALGVWVRGLDFFRSRVSRKIVSALWQTVQAYRPHLIHVHGGRAAFFLAQTRKCAPVIYTVHGMHWLYKPLPISIAGRLADAWTMRWVDQVVFVARYELERARQARVLPPGKPAEVIYNGIQMPKDKPSSNGPTWHVGFVGRMEAEKDPACFLEMVRLLPSVRAVMIGDGALRSKVQRLVNTYGLKDRVAILGFQSRQEVFDLLNRIEILVLTSRWEGLPITVLEAMAVGVPVIASAVGGIAEIVEEGVTGMLVRDHTPESFARVVRCLLDNAPLRRTMAELARRRVRELFDQRVMLSKLDVLYRRWYSGR